MEKLTSALINLIQIKKLIALSFSIVFLIQTLKGVVDVSTFMGVFTMIVGVYFGQSIIKDNK